MSCGICYMNADGCVYVEGYKIPAYIVSDIERWVKRQGLVFFAANGG